MKFQTVSVRTWSFFQFVLLRFTSKEKLETGFSERLKLKDDAVATILDTMQYHTSVSNCFHYVINIALSVITDHLICTNRGVTRHKLIARDETKHETEFTRMRRDKIFRLLFFKILNDEIYREK